MAARKTLSATRLIAAKRESLRNLSKEVRAIEQNADSIRAVLALTAPFEKMADYTYGYAEGSWGELGVYVTARFAVCREVEREGQPSADRANLAFVGKFTLGELLADIIAR